MANPLSASVPGKWEINGQEFVVNFGIYVSPDDYMIVRKIEEFDSLSGVEKHWMKIRLWSYLERSQIRKKCIEWSPQRNTRDFDEDRYNMYRVQKCLVDWSLSVDNERIKVLTVNGVMSDQTWNSIMKIRLPILNFVFNEIERLVERYV